ncbi:MAG TPA: YdeI/OmpD-associated family protein [Verrucomicrobiae bacterium]|jgi:uncharacterized protein YdeI (YjbR/CyaY-like superfamily)|nr:YdeI/OmpD-associated family protein [Verrucomicrobiae bacterium]
MKAAKPLVVPAAMKAALARDPQAKVIFKKLSPSHRNEYVRWISEAKQPVTVQRRLEKFIPMLIEKNHAKNYFRAIS